MTGPSSSSTPKRASIGRKPAADPASTWVRQADAPENVAKASIFTARLTIDVTPALRGRIKVIAFERGVTAAEMLRELLECEYGGGQS
ncbi:MULTISPECIES: ribbon-helix-helix protein [Variovorax]|uniref:Chromosome partitioning protein ParB n=1 Tax=Variovorax ginsengisoli TaxID=363844 RepID=A0ABT8S8T1_9BURK|nr:MULTISPECIES: chromosome partitioning protein ParB [Variovorax]MDM0054609.1 chromosome partitioning protein ParB [Variovorax sp. J22G47]MDM0091571.1 chromosome partitioning protein ParB [Variovorax sp. J22G40]MDM0148774.1 chromosome partitioning protein ParB [Variovorax sp. J2P1-31]MDN8616145.1 chromosome partitioning protein ParB [Variovorax ginsengisoli]MDO1535315.1 chromosome partitioning protein ParB [Variovorax ginsengisoli]